MNKAFTPNNFALRYTSPKDRCLEAIARAAKRWRQLTLRSDNIPQEKLGEIPNTELAKNIQAAADHLLQMRIDAHALEIQHVRIDEAYERGITSAESSFGLASTGYTSRFH